MAGCATLEAPERPQPFDVANPVWDEARIREHLRYLNREQMEGRATATPGGAEAASYIAARMGEARLQPSSTDFRIRYTLPVNDSVATALNVAGFIAGMHPAFAREAVIVCADYDGPGQDADVSLMRSDRLGTGVAALLELARQYSQFSRFTNLPDRTIMFAAWSGSLLDHAGLKAYLDHPIWPAARIRALVYLGLAPEQEAEVRYLVERMGIRFISVPVQNTIDSGARIMPPGKLDRSTALDAARAEALRLLSAAFPVINAEVVTSQPPMIDIPSEVPKVPASPAE